MHEPGDTQGRVLYVRRRKEDRPRCGRCGTPYRAGSTHGPVTYYYPACRCVVPNRKMRRRPLDESCTIP